MKPGPVTNLGSIGGAPDPTTVPEVATGMNKLHADQGNLQSNQPVADGGSCPVIRMIPGPIVSSVARS